MRKNIFRTVIAVVLVCSMLVIPAFAEAATVTGSEVNLRSGPGVNYSVLACLPRGASVTVTDRSNSEWYAVSYNGNEGFMSSRYLSITEEGSSSGTVVVETESNGYINANYVRFRSGPSTDSSILGEYNSGKEVYITGTSGDWTACTINGRSGYVFSQYVTAYDSGSSGGGDSGGSGGAVVVVPGESQEPEATPVPTAAPGGDDDVIVVVPSQAPAVSPSPTPVPTATPSPTVKPGDDDVIVVGPTVTPTPSPVPTSVPTPTPSVKPGDDDVVVVDPVTPTPSPSPSTEPVDSKPGYIDGDYVRFRSGPSTSYSILGTYNTGKALTITGYSGEWTACTIDGVSGYVYSQYVKEEDDTVVGPEDPDDGESGSTEPGYITGNNVRLRSGPSTSSSILGELFFGNSVTITGVSGDWTAVTYNGKAGYVFSQYVAKGEYTPPSPSGGSELGREIADYALQFVGYNYTWGGASPSTGFDCSGLMYYVYKQFGYTLNRVANDQARNGVHVDPSDLQPGDLLCFYSSGDYIGHVGMYIGNNMFVHAANSNTGVITSELSGYYATRGYEARRII